ncbi:MAG TPA: hypothetical protein VFE84_05840 [Patescibacteria group bacterium]|jgi:hypothetical protein|nr:hypothetical protein [Patescibacteria group bacterium]
MSRIVMGRTIELHYQSPNEMVAHLADAVQTRTFFFETAAPPKLDEVRELLIHVPWLGQEIRLSGRVTRVEGQSPAAGVHMTLQDGPHDRIALLGEVIGKLRTGAILEDTRDSSASSSASLPPEQRIRAMSSTLRAMLAAKANPEERLILARDADPRVIEFLLKNPSLSLEEVRRLVSRLNLHQGHFAMIARNPVWMNDELVRATLARNPRLPEFMAEAVLTPMSTPFLKSLAESMNTTAATRRVAGRILQTRGIVIAGRRSY